MEAEVWTVVGLLLIVLFVSSVLTLPNFVGNEQARAFKGFYEKYLDILVVSLTVAVGLFALAFGMGILLQRGSIKDLYVFAALILLTLRNALLFVDLSMNTPEKWLLSSVAHLFDLGIALFLYLAIRE